MGIKYRNNIRTANFIDRMTRNAEKELKRALEEEAREIVKRTQSGRDADGKPFEPYSPAYFAKKTKAGRRGNVDLTYTGNMLKAITSKVTRIGNGIIQGKIFFSSALEASKARGNQEKRPFFGLSDEQVTRIVQRLRGLLKK